MNKMLIKNGLVHNGKDFISADLLIEDGKITKIEKDIKQLENTIDASGLKLVPGFIDIHTHGAMGVDINAANEEDYKTISKFFASQGTTSYLASVLTDTRETTLKCLGEIKKAMEQKENAQLLGCHLEGPFLNPKYKGAMPEHLLQTSNAALLEEYLSTGVAKYITMAPELDGAMEILKSISKRICVALGHTAADYYTAMEAVENGARCITHCFNAMKLFHQHEPAVMGAALESKGLYCEAICDGLHLHPGTVSMLLSVKGFERFIAVTDSIMAAGLKDGDYMLGVNEVVVKNGDARLKCNDSRAGSTLTMIRALKNIIKFTKKSLAEVVPLMSTNAAKAIGVYDSKGSLDIGKDADIVLLDDNIDICYTICRGNIAYKK